MEMGESVDIETSLHNLKESIMCPICLEDWNDPVTLTCSHIFCKSCINEVNIYKYMINILLKLSGDRK